MHRVVAGEPPCGLEIDHINGNGLDNRRANLRFVTHAQNLANQRPQQGRTSRFRGVCWLRRDQVWRAQIKSGGKTCYLGCFADEEDAARAYDASAVAE